VWQNISGNADFRLLAARASSRDDGISSRSALQTNNRRVALEAPVRIRLRIITQRMPNPRRTEPAQWKAMTGIIGPLSVPLEFDPGH
jgi:hypothetical protein